MRLRTYIYWKFLFLQMSKSNENWLFLRLSYGPCAPFLVVPIRPPEPKILGFPSIFMFHGSYLYQTLTYAGLTQVW